MRRGIINEPPRLLFPDQVLHENVAKINIRAEETLFYFDLERDGYRRSRRGNQSDI
jgi:hypothetical protein